MAEYDSAFEIRISRTSRTPVYQQIYDALKGRILARSLPVGTAFPSQEAYSQLLGVNHLTLRHALGLLQDEGLVRRQQGVGTFVQPSSEWSTPHNVPRLGVVFNWRVREEPSYFLNLYADICRLSASLGMEIITFSDPKTPLNERVIELDIDGLIAFSTVSNQDIKLLERVRVPKLILELSNRQAGLDNVMIDCHDGVYDATAELIRLGHRRIFYISALIGYEYLRAPQDAFQRQKAFREAMDDANIPTGPDCIFEIPFEQKDADELVARLLAMQTPPTALQVFDDCLAEYVIRALNKHGVLVPDDISVAGFGGLPTVDETLNLATADVDFARMAELAVHRIFERISHGGIADVQLSVPTRFRTGATIGPPKS